MYFLVRFGAKRKDTIVPKRGGVEKNQIFFWVKLHCSRNR